MTGRLRAIACALSAALAGCYHVGYEPEPGLEALAVPLFENRTLRRELEHALTRHVRRELLETTPIRLVAEGEAARVLRGSITEVTEGPLVVGRFQDVLHSSVTVSVTFGVQDRDGTLIIGEDGDGDGTPDASFARVGYAEFTPGRGETREQALDEALRDLAELVVAELAAREDDRREPNDGPAEAAAIGAGRQAALQQRNEDWFRVEVPPGHRLRATAYAPAGPLALEARDPGGAPLPDARPDPGRRRVEVDAGAEARVVLLRVAGDDAGARYSLVVRLAPAGP